MVVVLLTFAVGVFGDGMLDAPVPLLGLEVRSFFRLLTIAIVSANSIKRYLQQRPAHRPPLLVRKLAVAAGDPGSLSSLRLFFPAERGVVPGEVPGVPVRAVGVSGGGALTRSKTSWPTSATSGTGNASTPSGSSWPPCCSSSPPKSSVGRTTTPWRRWTRPSSCCRCRG